MDYSQLEKLSAEKYLDWNSFETDCDSFQPNLDRKYAEIQYNKGVEIGKNANVICISHRSIWSSCNKDGSLTSSYEGIGYHACTKDLLHGFIDSGCTLAIRRLIKIGDRFEFLTTIIKNGKIDHIE